MPATDSTPNPAIRTLLLCDLLDPDGQLAGGYQIAVDNIGAGAGETVLLLDEGNGARQVLGAPGAPIRTVVIGIVDEVITLSNRAGEATVRLAAVTGN